MSAMHLSLSDFLTDLDGHGIVVEDPELAAGSFSDTSCDGVDDLIELLDELDGFGIILTDADLVDRYARRNYLFPLAIQE